MFKANQPLCILCWVTALAFAALVATVRGDDPTAEQLPTGLKVVSIEAQPASIELQHKFDYRQVLITGKLASGESADLTRMVKATQEGLAVTVSSDGLVRAKADGTSKLTFSFADKSIEVPVRVSGIEVPHTVSFVRDVQPALSRMGCNQGTCHGSKDGKLGSDR
jgi:hypothetical protein